MLHGILLQRYTNPKPKEKRSQDPATVQPLSQPKWADSQNGGRWRPLSLRISFLVGIAVATLALIAAIAFLVVESSSRRGLVFAPQIADLSLARSFWYRYFPTIIAVVYSIASSWIDLDTKRTEPWRRLSRASGASAEDSVLLQYPFDFLPTVPFKALRKRHWPVVLSASTYVLVSWGFVPLQAAMFATKDITMSRAMPMHVSTTYLPSIEQADVVTAGYSYSVYGIAWLNERLPSYMSREAVIFPFQPKGLESPQDSETWTSSTTLCSVDVECQKATINSQRTYYMPSFGCEVPFPYGVDGNDTIGNVDAALVKQYSALYAGYNSHAGYADYYLSSYCPANSSHVFMVTFAGNKQHATDDPESPTTLFCNPTYYQQQAEATVQRADLSIVNYTTTGAKQPLSTDMFNVSRLEWQMNSAVQQEAVRGGIPAAQWPDQDLQLQNLPITLGSSQLMVGLAVGAYQRPMDEYLDPETLRLSYQAAYRLLFARAMVDVIQPASFDNGNVTQGIRTLKTQAVQVVPGFAYAVLGLLTLVLILIITLMVLLQLQKCKLQSDPGSLSALMTLVAEERTLLDQMCALDQMDALRLEQYLRGSRYGLEEDSGRCHLRLLSVSAASLHNAKTSKGFKRWCSMLSARSWRFEMSPFTGAALATLLAVWIAFVAYLYMVAKDNGVSLHSNSRFIRQMVENFIPTLFATLLEPVWIHLTTLLSVLRPLDQLSRGVAPAKRSVDLNYSALPAQFVLFRAVSAKHFALGAAGTMALLANALAVAFSGLLNEHSTLIDRPINVTTPYQDWLSPQRPVYADSEYAMDHFYVAMSNLTSGSPLPTWTDEDGSYVPFSDALAQREGLYHTGRTRRFGLETECRPLEQQSSNSWELAIDPTLSIGSYWAKLTIKMQDDDLGEIACQATDLMMSSQLSSGQCPESDSALEMMTPMGALRSASPEVKRVCNQYIAAAWIRSAANDRCFISRGNGTTPSNLSDQNTVIIACRPKLVSRGVDLTINAVNIVQSSHETGPSDPTEKYFHGDADDLVEKTRNIVLSATASSTGFGTTGEHYGGTWHADGFPSDWNNYIIQHMNGSNAFLDPKAPIPPTEELMPLLQKMYSKLFAIWLSMNKEKFLVSAPGLLPQQTGHRMVSEIRMFVSRPMFFISEVILALYVIAVAAIYVRRPGRNLPCMPTTIASNIAMFAASRVLEDFREDAMLDKREKEGARYGYGTYLGRDRNVHVGIEKVPFVTTLKSRRGWRDMFGLRS